MTRTLAETVEMEQRIGCLHNIYIDLTTRRVKIGLSMYACVMRNATQVRRFTITDNSPSGWEVCEEHDNLVVRRVLYDDWHRVERAKMTFARIAVALKAAGWEEN